MEGERHRNQWTLALLTRLCATAVLSFEFAKQNTNMCLVPMTTPKTNNVSCKKPQTKTKAPSYHHPPERCDRLLSAGPSAFRYLVTGCERYLCPQCVMQEALHDTMCHARSLA